ncbi:Ig-like domain-containing protein, partial [Vibrio sp. 10N.261.46.F12]|uniref:Ig-like domain-containing protein n=1 Tax=Vibrio sp. 10N.261.46.F12 TaxID=1880846 RepID=UPI001056214A
MTIDTVIKSDGGRLAAESDSGRTDSDGITNDATPILNGIAEKGADVTVIIRDVKGSKVTTIRVRANEEGYWEANSAIGEPGLPDNKLLDGEYTWTVT